MEELIYYCENGYAAKIILQFQYVMDIMLINYNELFEPTEKMTQEVALSPFSSQILACLSQSVL